MTTTRQTAIVAGNVVVGIDVSASDVHTAQVTVRVGPQRWEFDEPAWQDLRFGVFAECVAIWSARRLLLLDLRTRALETIATDEDLRLVFAANDRWLLICEASLRLHDQEREVARAELGDVVVEADWAPPTLRTRADSGREDRFLVRDHAIQIVT